MSRSGEIVSSRTVWKLLAAVVGAASIAVVLLGVAILTRSSQGFDSSFAALTWIVPIAAGFLVGGVAWALLATGDRAVQRAPIRCDSCGASILEGWRICPHCGHFIGDGVDRTERVDATA